VVDDVVRGQVEFANRDLEDFVIRRCNGTPVFLVANAVDDADMGITHVVRGEDLLNTTPKVRLLWDALGFGEPPTYAHLPLLVGEDRKKLSKRKSSVALADFEAQGFIPEAMVNYLALLGWGPPDDVEIRPVSEIIELFSLEDVNKAPAFFDMKKLSHINSSYIRELELTDFKARVQPWLTDRAPWTSEQYRPEVFEALAEIIQSKVRTLAEAPSFIDWLMFDDAPTDEKSWEKTMVKGKASREMLDGVIAGIDDVDWTHEGMYNLVSSVGEANELKLGKAQAPIRVAVTGRTVGPPLFESIVLLDRGEVRRRLELARAQLG
jgi:glutamyl-tRNA synthetase